MCNERHYVSKEPQDFMRKYHQNAFSSGKQNNLTLFVSVAIAIQIVPQEKELYFFCGSLMNLTNFALPLQVAPIKSLGMLRITISPTVSKCSVHILLLILLLLPLFFFFFPLHCALINYTCSIHLFLLSEIIHTSIHYLQSYFDVVFFLSASSDPK